jgi:Uma2 family endonuclease
MLQHVDDSKDPNKRRATYEDLEAVPEGLKAEIIDGELHIYQHPASGHQLAASILVQLLGPPLQLAKRGPGSWWIIHEPWVEFGKGNIFRPDLAGWRRERMPSYIDVNVITLAPDWVCEVHSPSTVKVDRGRKLQFYAQHGVTHAWYIDPLDRWVEIYELQDARLVMCATYGGNERIRAVPFESVEIPLAYLWGETPAPAERPAPGS